MGLFSKKSKAEPVVTAEVKPEIVATPEISGDSPLVIKIFCAGGFSTSLWALKTEEALHKHGIAANVTAYPVANIEIEGADADAILIGPQTRYVEADAKKSYPKKIVEVVPLTIFGRVDGEANVQYLKEIGVI